LLEDLTDQVAEAADGGGDQGGGEVGAAVAAQGDEDDMVTVVLTSEAFDATAGNHTARVSQQHDLEQHGGWEGRRTGVVVVEASVEGAEVDLVVEQMVQRVLEGAGQSLGFEVNGKKARAGVDLLVAGHAVTPNR
jgi:hypothetical protein